MIEHWKVSPNIGLNGFSISKYKGLFVMPKVTVFRNLSILDIFNAGSRRIGAYDMLKINLSKLLSAEKMSTGREMFKIDFPETIFLAT